MKGWNCEKEGRTGVTSNPVLMKEQQAWEMNDRDAAESHHSWLERQGKMGPLVHEDVWVNWVQQSLLVHMECVRADTSSWKPSGSSRKRWPRERVSSSPYFSLFHKPWYTSQCKISLASPSISPWKKLLLNHQGLSCS